MLIKKTYNIEIDWFGRTLYNELMDKNFVSDSIWFNIGGAWGVC